MIRFKHEVFLISLVNEFVIRLSNRSRLHNKTCNDSLEKLIGIYSEKNRPYFLTAIFWVETTPTIIRYLQYFDHIFIFTLGFVHTGVKKGDKLCFLESNIDGSKRFSTFSSHFQVGKSERKRKISAR